MLLSNLVTYIVEGAVVTKLKHLAERIITIEKITWAFV